MSLTLPPREESGRDPAAFAGYDATHPGRKGFFTDTSVCIGCKACEVACKTWNEVPEDGISLLGSSYDNTGTLGADTWRHVAFIEQRTSAASQAPAAAEGRDGEGFRWLMSSDVCKHCTSAACLDVCPTGALFRTEFGTVVVQQEVCNGCGYCVPACPFGVIDQRKGDGRVWKCTLCYDRLKVGQHPACAQACPTESIQYGDVEELRQRAASRLRTLHDAGVEQAQLYLAGEDDGVGGAGAFFLLLDDPEVYRLPPDPVSPTRDLAGAWKAAGLAAISMVAGIAAAFAERVEVGRGEQRMVPDAQPVDVRTYYERPVLKEPTWKWFIPAYFFAGGLAAGSSLLAAAMDATGDEGAARRARWVALPAIAAGSAFLVADLGRPERFHHMLRVAKPSSPMSTGTWILALYAPAAGVAALTDTLGRLPRLRGVATWVAAATAPLVATYTAVLVADTSIPAWHDARTSLPALFASSATAASAGAAIAAGALARDPASSAVRTVGVAASVLEVASAATMEHQLVPTVRTAYQSGPARLWGTAAKVLGTAGAALVVVGRRRRSTDTVGGLLMVSASLCERFSVAEAGKASARDPRATVGPQRRHASAAT